MRTHLVPSAAFWYDAAKRKAQDCLPDQALLAMEQAYNHVENALAAEQEKSAKLRAFLLRHEFVENGNIPAQEWAEVLKE